MEECCSQDILGFIASADEEFVADVKNMMQHKRNFVVISIAMYLTINLDQFNLPKSTL